jgi:glyoxylate/hydroxypyruvate reductase A
VIVVLHFPGAAGAQWLAAFARALPEAAVHRWPDAPAEADYAVVWRPPAGLFDRVRIRCAVMNLGAGVDGVIGLRSLPQDVPLVRVEDAGMADQMAEYTTYAVLRAYREFDRYAETQHAARWSRRARIAKTAFGVGILGLGMLGRRVVAALRPFGFPLAGWSRTRHAVAGVEACAGADELPAFLARSRVLICLLPSTPATRGLLNRATLGALPAGAHVVNVARGDLVVDADLLALLDDGHLGSATLDVFHEEPLPPEHPFWHHAKVTVTPHISAVTLVDETVAQVAAKMRALSRGEAVSGIVDRARGY